MKRQCINVVLFACSLIGQIKIDKHLTEEQNVIKGRKDYENIVQSCLNSKLPPTKKVIFHVKKKKNVCTKQ